MNYHSLRAIHGGEVIYSGKLRFLSGYKRMCSMLVGDRNDMKIMLNCVAYNHSSTEPHALQRAQVSFNNTAI